MEYHHLQPHKIPIKTRRITVTIQFILPVNKVFLKQNLLQRNENVFLYFFRYNLILTKQPSNPKI
ncbi:hypothetical protein IMSAGC014_01792 [Bacteroidaceae bacterium]|nr:hypothetical protein IMSAGC014_01792 [Bacteroidaceae bacterium]